MNYRYLEKLIEEIKHKPEFKGVTFPELDSEPSDQSFAMVCNAFLDAIKHFNKTCGMNLISMGNLSVDIFKLILNFDQSNACFYLESRDKYVFVFNENSGQISFFGRYKNENVTNRKVRRNFVQLFKINTQLKNGTIRLNDNTGNDISTDEIIYQILRWLLL